MSSNSNICIDCKKKVVYSHGTYFCEECANYFYKGDNMKKFIIRLDDKYYVGEGESVKRNTSGNGWHVSNLGSSTIAVSNKEENAKVIEGFTNLNSNWQRIYNALRFKEFNCDVIIIETVKEKSK